MQKLEIRGFLGIKEADIIIDGLTVLIGPQASGKSIIARLFYFFNEYFSDFDDLALMKNEHKKTYDKRKKDTFSQLFPPYSWEGETFEIKFERHPHSVKIFSKKGSSSIELQTSESVAQHFRELKRKFSEFAKSIEEQDGNKTIPLAKSKIIRHFRFMKEELNVDTYGQALFVPAARSFYAAIREEIFSILSIDEKIDKIIIQFGEFYESAKNYMSSDSFHRINSRKSANNYHIDYFNSVIRGKYVRIDSKDWIEMDRGRIEVSKASSGQQEALPLLVALTRFPRSGRTLIIEEPEAHLFPDSQVKILEFIVIQSMKRNTDILITTHSPYILSSLNNNILKGRINRDLLGSIPIDKVKAYAIQNKVAKSLIDEETQLVSAEYIDSVSEHISKEFYELLEKLDEQ
ncbi:AAA family ATPase [Acetobacter persici]|uniref:AAA family ATPase n=1 Tax=Acetobacter persici TaxID=1076596 RepID=UPI001BA651CC|nr:ATP-binding protein [Acetobacter persici]MBS0963383.1 ATP-binding protein [Acetobacter persici]